MSEGNSTAVSINDKSSKPYAAFPLFRHTTGQWAKKVRGKLHYFGTDPDAALTKYLEKKDDLHAGRTPRPDQDALTIKDLTNAFLNHKQVALDAGELSSLTWQDYKTVCDLIVGHLGKRRLVSDLRAEDFAKLRNRLAGSWGPHRLSKSIQFIRCVFKYGYEAELLDKPIRFGPGFKRPSKKTLRLHRAKQGPKLFTSEEIRRMLDTASVQLRAMILLGINTGAGNSDCGNLPTTALDLNTGILDFPRPKTGISRRAMLWPETVGAIKQSLAERPEPKRPKHANLVFITRCGDSWAKDSYDGPISRETGKLLRKLKINIRKGLGFYTLRHVFRTVADESKDQPAVDLVMGHESPHMSTAYRESISNERLKAVSDYVRNWLWPTAEKGGVK